MTGGIRVTAEMLDAGARWGGKKASQSVRQVIYTAMAAVDPTRSELRDALEAARDHLEYCGYGDAWERECAEARDLSGKIERALGNAE